jgi:hypothetical protein
MTGNDTTGLRSDWEEALQVVSRLAAAHDAALQDIDVAQQGTAVSEAEQRSVPATAPMLKPAAAIDTGQLARAVAEIEQAASALRRSEPALEPWRPGQTAHDEKRRHRSVWILIGGIWISTGLVVTAAATAILYFFG